MTPLALHAVQHPPSTLRRCAARKRDGKREEGEERGVPKFPGFHPLGVVKVSWRVARMWRGYSRTGLHSR